MPPKKTPKPFLKKITNQNILIAIIGAGATVLAGILPTLIDRAAVPAPTETAAPPSVTATFTSTSIPPTATITPTFTPVPPSETPTTPIGIYNAYLTLDEEGQYKTDVFSPEQYIYFFYSINDPSGLNNVRVVWYAVKVQGFKPNIVINQYEQTVTKKDVFLQVKTDPIWAVGQYKIEIYLNSILANSISFEVKK
jgi:hypothetical protein